jgi:hypothetical protein
MISNSIPALEVRRVIWTILSESGREGRNFLTF